MSRDFALALRAKLREDMNNLADDVATGGMTSFEEYKRVCGVITGLAQAERHVLDLLEKAEKHDESDPSSARGSSPRTTATY